MKKVLKYGLIILICLIILGFSGTYMYLRNLNPGYGQDGENLPESIDTPKPVKNEPVNVLILGVDRIDKSDKGRSDTIMLLSYNPGLKKANLISIPRDTRIKLDRYGYQKINAAYAYEDAEGSMRAVSDLLDIPVHYYVKIDYDGFIKLVDDLGGIKVDVPVNMDYDDDAGNLHIHLKKGEQVLNGEEALGLVRYRKGYLNQDLGRIKTQQLFVDAFIDKVTSPAMLLNANKILNTISDYVETNMTPAEILSYVDDAVKVGRDIKMYTLPGDTQYIDNISYYIVNKDDVEEILKDVSTAGSASNNTADGEAEKIIDKYGLDPADISVEVLNGGAPGGSATEVGDILRGYGFNVKRISNLSGTEYHNTQVINRKEDIKTGKMVSELIRGSVLIDDPDPSADVDVTIIVGKSYN